MYIGLYGGSILIHEVRLVSSVADPVPGSGAFLTNESGIRIRDPGWKKNQDPDPGSGMNIPNFSDSETAFRVKNT
jgi:hypothetical protein